MKSRVLFSILVVAVTAFSIQAQPPGGGRGVRGGGGFGGGIGETVADILALNNTLAKTVTEKMNAVQQDLRDEMRSSFQGDGGNDMRARMQEMRETMNAKTVEALKSVLPVSDVETVEPFLNGRGGRAYAPVRAVRQLELTDNQRSAIRNENIVLFTALQDLRPDDQGGQGRGQRGQGRGQGGQGRGQGGGVDEATRAKMENVRAAYLEKVVALLTDTQLTPWETKISEVEAELESQRGQRGPRGGGQGGNAGGQRRRGGN